MVSESSAWFDVARIARRLQSSAPREAEQLRLLSQQMQRQLSRGVHENPGSLVMHLAGNPGGGGVSRRALIARDVLWIVYRHDDDGLLYGHAFGETDFDIRSGKRDEIVLTGTADASNVRAYARPDGAVLLKHRDGLPVWEEMER